jgi:hypothetical protein
MAKTQFKPEWSDTEHAFVLRAFAKWERRNLIVTYGKRERSCCDTYGLPYTSGCGFAMLSNTNVAAELKVDRRFAFEYLAIRDDGIAVAVCRDSRDNEKYIVISRGKANTCSGDA